MADTSDEILARIVAEYGVYANMAAFWMGFDDYRERTPLRDDLGGVSQQAYDRGANAAMLHWQALSYIDNPSPEAARAAAIAVGEKPQDPPAVPGWLARLIRGGR